MLFDFRTVFASVWGVMEEASPGSACQPRLRKLQVKSPIHDKLLSLCACHRQTYDVQF